MRRRVCTAVALTLATAALESAGLLILVQLLSLTGLPTSGASVGRMIGLVSQAFDRVGIRPTLAAVLHIYVAVVCTQALVKRAQLMAAHDVQHEAQFHMRTRLYAAFARARWSTVARNRRSDLLHALTDEVARAGNAVSNALNMVTQALVGAVYLAFAVAVSYPVTLIALACAALITPVLRRQRQVARDSGQGLGTAMENVIGAVTEHLSAIKTIKGYGAEDRSVRVFMELSGRSVRLQQAAARAAANARLGITAGSVILLAITTYVAIDAFAVPGTLAVLLIFYYSRLVPRVIAIQQSYHELLGNLPAAEAVHALTRVLEAEREQSARGPEMTPPFTDAIRLENVSFAYQPGMRNVIQGMELRIEARRWTAIVGTSGAGKTTIADLLMGLIRPTWGLITVDGAPLEEPMVHAWRERIGYVTQDTLVFEDTVLANMRWARPDATEAEVWEALRGAGADSFVNALPDSLHSYIGERGMRLSGGERQRLELARALLRQPALLILDEATSALDSETERKILQSLRTLRGKTTVLQITHRLGSAARADMIHVIENGRRVESGEWKTLIARAGGRFRTMWESAEVCAESASP